MLTRLVILFGLSFLAACTQSADTGDADTGDIQGSALLRTQGGEVRTCGGDQVYIAPTGSAGQVIEKLLTESIEIERGIEDFYMYYEGTSWDGTNGYMPYLSDSSPRSVSKRVEEFNLTATAAEDGKIVAAPCDLQGNFNFSGLSAGDYYVAGAVFWMVGNQGQGGLMVKKVQVDAGKTATVQLMR